MSRCTQDDTTVTCAETGDRSTQSQKNAHTQYTQQHTYNKQHTHTHKHAQTHNTNRLPLLALLPVAWLAAAMGETPCTSWRGRISELGRSQPISAAGSEHGASPFQKVGESGFFADNKSQATSFSVPSYTTLTFFRVPSNTNQKAVL